MGQVLKWVGGIWALIGAADIVIMFGKGVGSGIATFGLIFNFVLFVLPGLAVFGIGARMSAPKPAGLSTTSRESSEQRLQKLNELREKGLLRPEEYEERRSQILQEI